MQIDVYYKLKHERLKIVYDDVVNWYFLTKRPEGYNKALDLDKWRSYPVINRVQGYIITDIKLSK